MAASSTPPVPTPPSARPTDTLQEQPSDSSITSADTPTWTEQDEQELVEIKAKLHQAHKTWSADQELWHERYEELEERKRKHLKSEKKKAKVAKKEAAGDEGIEASKLSKALRRVSGVPSTLVPHRRSNTITPGNPSQSTSQNISGNATPGSALSGSAIEDEGQLSRAVSRRQRRWRRLLRLMKKQRSNSSSISDIASRLGHLRKLSLGGGNLNLGLGGGKKEREREG